MLVSTLPPLNNGLFSLQVVAFLPPAGKEAEVNWVYLEEASPIQDITWDVRTLQPPLEQANPQYGESPKRINNAVCHCSCQLSLNFSLLP